MWLHCQSICLSNNCSASDLSQILYRHDIPSKAEWAQSSRSWQLNRNRGTYTSAPTREALPSELSSSLQFAPPGQLLIRAHSNPCYHCPAVIWGEVREAKVAGGRESQETWREQGLRGGQRAGRKGFKSRQPGFISSTVTEQLISQYYSSAKKPLKGVICTAQLILHFQNLYLLAFWILPPPWRLVQGEDLIYPQQAELNIYRDGGRKRCIITSV